VIEKEIIWKFDWKGAILALGGADPQSSAVSFCNQRDFSYFLLIYQLVSIRLSATRCHWTFSTTIIFKITPISEINHQMML
jgi:hypothetical protein